MFDLVNGSGHPIIQVDGAAIEDFRYHSRLLSSKLLQPLPLCHSFLPI